MHFIVHHQPHHQAFHCITNVQSLPTSSLLSLPSASFLLCYDHSQLVAVVLSLSELHKPGSIVVVFLSVADITKGTATVLTLFCAFYSSQDFKGYWGVASCLISECSVTSFFNNGLPKLPALSVCIAEFCRMDMF